MNATSFVVVTVVVAVAGAIIWFSLHRREDNLQENTNETLETLITPKLSTEAWLFFNYKENGTVIVFNPANMSLAPQHIQGLNTKIFRFLSAQNDRLGILVGLMHPEGGNEIYVFDVQQKKVIRSIETDIDYDNNNFGISDVNAVIFTYPTIVECQTIFLISTLDNEIVESDVAPNVCRKEPYCVASMNTGDVYVFGGLDASNQDILFSEKYSVESGTFVAVADFPSTLVDSNGLYCIATEYKGNVFVCGKNKNDDRSCYNYNTASDNWELVGGFVTDREYYKLLVVGENLFVVGGYNIDTIERYDPEKKVWEVFMTDIDYINEGNEFIAFSVYK